MGRITWRAGRKNGRREDLAASFCGLLWASVGFCGLLWTSVGFCGLLQASLGFCGLLWASVNFSGLLRASGGLAHVAQHDWDCPGF